jgi:5'-nucleotidase (lipoprotein e(P4) family)
MRKLAEFTSALPGRRIHPQEIAMRPARVTRNLVVAAAVAWLAASPGFAADAPPQNDLLNAELWMQTAIEYRANCLTVYVLARTRLDEALADRSWTAFDQTGNYQDLPPAVILDLDETAIDNSAYEAGLAVTGGDFDAKSWDAWTKAEQAKAIPGAVEFTTYAAAKGVKVFYVSNRTADQKAATQRNMQALGFPMGGNVDTFLLQKDRPEWAVSAKGVRIADVAKDYRVLLLFGDNIGDFSDKYNGSIAERSQTFETLKAHFGHDWMMLANPSYGSWESAAYGHNFKLSADEKRAKKFGVLTPWPTKQ